MCDLTPLYPVNNCGWPNAVYVPVLLALRVGISVEGQQRPNLHTGLLSEQLSARSRTAVTATVLVFRHKTTKTVRARSRPIKTVKILRREEAYYYDVSRLFVTAFHTEMISRLP